MSNIDILAMAVGKLVLSGVALILLGVLSFYLLKHWRLIAKIVLAVLYLPFFALKKGLLWLGHSRLAH